MQNFDMDIQIIHSMTSEELITIAEDVLRWRTPAATAAARKLKNIANSILENLKSKALES